MFFILPPLVEILKKIKLTVTLKAGAEGFLWEPPITGNPVPV